MWDFINHIAAVVCLLAANTEWVAALCWFVIRFYPATLSLTTLGLGPATRYREAIGAVIKKWILGPDRLGSKQTPTPPASLAVGNFACASFVTQGESFFIILLILMIYCANECM